MTDQYHGGSNWPIQDIGSGKQSTTQAVVLGLGSMFNHSAQEQNIGWERDVMRGCVRYYALRDIAAGEELCINYGRIWFVDEDGEGTDEESDGAERLGRIEID